MRELDIFRTFDEAAAALDNGGRFWNLRSKQDDGVVTEAEFGVVGGDFGATRDALIRVSLQCSGLPHEERLALFQMLDPVLQRSYAERGAALGGTLVIRGLGRGLRVGCGFGLLPTNRREGAAYKHRE